MDRDVRRAQARLEGRRARGLGPAVALQMLAGISAVICGGLLTLGGMQDIYRYGGQYGSDAVEFAILFLSYTAVGLAQAILGWRLSLRQELARRGKLDDAALGRAVMASLAASATHVLMPLGCAIYFALRSYAGMAAAGWGPPDVGEILAMAATTLVPLEILPVIALVLTWRAWRRVSGDTEQDVVDPDGNITRLDPEQIRTNRWAAAIGRAGGAQLAAALPGLLCGGGFLVEWLASGWTGVRGTPAGHWVCVVFLWLHLFIALAQCAAGLQLMGRRSNAAICESPSWSFAQVTAAANVVAVAAVLVGLFWIRHSGSVHDIAAFCFITAIAEVLPVFAWNVLRRTRKQIRAEQDERVADVRPAVAP